MMTAKLSHKLAVVLGSQFVLAFAWATNLPTSYDRWMLPTCWLWGVGLVVMCQLAERHTPRGVRG